MKSGRVFLDTNLLVYSVDSSSNAKRLSAQEILCAFATGARAVVSTQVLGEFFWTSTRKIAEPLSQEKAEMLAHGWLASWTVVDVTSSTVKEAIRLSRAHRIAYWDAQVVASAVLHQIPFLFSEDLSHGSMLNGVRVVNPFRSDFKRSDWI